MLATSLLSQLEGLAWPIAVLGLVILLHRILPPWRVFFVMPRRQLRLDKERIKLHDLHDTRPDVFDAEHVAACTPEPKIAPPGPPESIAPSTWTDNTPERKPQP